MSLKLRKPSDDDYSSMLRQEEPPPPLPPSRHIRRWRIAVTATRFLVGITKKVVEKNAELLRSLSFVSIDIEGSGDERVPILDVDPQCLAKMVKEKNLQSFSDQYGGVKQVANLLQTDLKTGIPGKLINFFYFLHNLNIDI